MYHLYTCMLYIYTLYIIVYNYNIQFVCINDLRWRGGLDRAGPWKETDLPGSMDPRLGETSLIPSMDAAPQGYLWIRFCSRRFGSSCVDLFDFWCCLKVGICVLFWFWWRHQSFTCQAPHIRPFWRGSPVITSSIRSVTFPMRMLLRVGCWMMAPDLPGRKTSSWFHMIRAPESSKAPSGGPKDLMVQYDGSTPLFSQRILGKFVTVRCSHMDPWAFHCLVNTMAIPVSHSLHPWCCLAAADLWFLDHPKCLFPRSPRYYVRRPTVLAASAQMQQRFLSNETDPNVEESVDRNATASPQQSRCAMQWHGHWNLYLHR